MTLSIFLTKLLAFADQVLLLLWRVVTFVGRTACDISLLIIETVQSIRIKGTPIRESQYGFWYVATVASRWIAAVFVGNLCASARVATVLGQEFRYPLDAL